MRPLALLGLLVSLLPVGEARALPAGKGALDEGVHRVEAELLLDVDGVRPGQPFRAGVRFRMDEGWHVYWRHPGESGLETEVDLRGARFAPLRWPFPQTFRTGGDFIRTYGYEDEVLLFAEGTAPEAPGAQAIEARADVLVCKVDCIPAAFELRRQLEVGEARRASPAAPLFDAAEARVPVHEDGLGFTVTATAGEEIRGALRIEPAGWRAEGEDAFVPDVSPGFETLRGTIRRGAIHVEGRPSVEATEPPRVRGVARLRSPAGAIRYVEVDAPVRAPAAPVAAAASEAPPLALVLLFAFGGGALLNLMPCVFPVLAVKVYGFTRLAAASRRGLASNAAAYALGVVGSLLFLAGAVVAARAAGASVGWGFQFQQPLFVAAVAAVVVAFALNLFGVFHVGLGSQGLVDRVDASRGLLRSVGEGVLAVVLATPCSAPLLGTAVGFAFAAPAWLTVLVFACLGLGLAAPFCLLVLVPGLAARLPRPGAWMERFKQALGFALLATAAWLVWVMGGLGGVDAMARLLAFLVAVAFGCWLLGLAQAAARRRWLGFSAALLVVGSSGGLLPTGAATEAVASTRAWSEEAVAAALAEGRPVFVDFTADWCLTCKFNERTVLASPRVRAAFEAEGVELLIADWTRRDERIREKLAAHGKAGVPLYLLYAPDRPARPRVLPELLTEGLVLDALASMKEP